MIIFEQYPLNGLETFEDELLFVMANKITLIAGLEKRSKIDGGGMNYCCIQCDPQTPFTIDSKDLTRVCKIFKKYNKSFKCLFEIKLIKTLTGRYKLNIQENMLEISTEAKKIMGGG